MSKGFCALGHCQRCGDTIGPWSLVGNEWLCDSCADIAEGEQVNVLGADDIQEMVEQGLLDLEDNNEIR